MNHKLKFRAWANKDKCMLDWLCICQTAFNGLDENGRGIMYRILTNQANANDNFGYVVMLFTGLLDKNGAEVYKDDIVLWNGRLTVIEYDVRMAGYYAMWKGEGVQFHSCQEIVPAHGGLMHIEVIGNRFQNPELLNQ